MMIEIRHRFTNNVICSYDVATVKEAVVKAVSDGANLTGADLTGADLTGANLFGANLYGANLTGANLFGANLYGANLTGADLYEEKLAISPITICGLQWFVLITESYLSIGCQRHTHDEWKKFNDEQISNMHPKALQFWKANKTWLLGACKVHRKESLKARKEND